MNQYQKLIEITSSPEVSLCSEIKELLGKELVLGMTRNTCRNGTLGEGFECLTDSQKYYQANKEVYMRSIEMKRLHANAKAAQADLLDANEEVEKASTESSKLRARSKVELSELRLFETLVSAEDTYRQLDEFNKVRLELKDKVRAQYPDGIEQAEKDNWSAVAKYRFLKQTTNGSGMESIPLSAMEKYQIGEILKRPDMMIELASSNAKPFSLT